MTTRTTETRDDDAAGRDPVAPDGLAAEVPEAEAGAWLFVAAREHECWPMGD